MRTVLILRPGALGDALLTLPLVEALMARGAERVLLLGTPASWGFLRSPSPPLELLDLDSRAWLGLFGEEVALAPRARALLAPVDTALVLLGRGRARVEQALRAAGLARVKGASPLRANPLSRKREREGAHPAGMGRVRDCPMPPPSLTLPLLRNGPLPLPLAGEGKVAPWPPSAAHAARRLMHCLPGRGAADWPPAPLALAAHPLLRLERAERAAALRQAALPAAPEGGILALHPGSGSAAKCWPAVHFARLAVAAARHLQLTPVFLVGPADGAAWSELRRALPPALAAHALVERPLREVLALVSLARAYVGNDSGVSHLAARACPVLALFGPSDPRVWHPLGAAVRVLSAAEGVPAKLSPETVLAALGKLLSPSSRGARSPAAARR